MRGARDHRLRQNAACTVACKRRCKKMMMMMTNGTAEQHHAKGFLSLFPFMPKTSKSTLVVNAISCDSSTDLVTWMLRFSEISCSPLPQVTGKNR